MSKNNKKKEPKQSLGASLLPYTNKSSKPYDPKFIDTIRKLKPHWFKKAT